MNHFQHYFIDVLTNKYFQFSGRATRSEFWYFILYSIIISFVLGLIGSVLGIEYVMQMDTVKVLEGTGELVSTTVDFPLNLLQIFFSLLLFIPSLAISIRRLHDLGRTGWWYLISLIPLLGALVLLIFFVLPSQEHDNEYGAYAHA